MSSAPSSAIVFPSAIQTLRHVVHKLEDSRGTIGRDSKFLWSDQTTTAPLRCTMSRETLREHLDDLHSLKSMSKGLHLLMDDLDAIIATRSEALLPAARHHGLASLPNEVFIHILRQLLRLYRDGFEGARVIIRDLSLVSKHFREMVLAFTEVWTYLDLKILRKDVLDMLLSRSKNAPLSVRFEYFIPTDEVLLRALEFHERWRHVYATFLFPVSISFDEDYSEELRIASPISFPLAQTLEIVPSPTDLRTQRCVRWTFPQLQVLRLAGGFPTPNGICRESLKEVQFAFSGNYGSEELGGLTDFLRPATSLHYLHLDAGLLLDLPDDAGVPTVELPSVKVFFVSNWRNDRSECDLTLYPSQFAKVISSVILPNVEDIGVGIEFWEDEFSVVDFLQVAFPRARHLRPVDTFRFNMLHIPEGPTATGERLVIVQVNEFFEHFPGLQRFELDSSDCEVDFSAKGGWVEELRFLKIAYGGSFIADLCHLLEHVAKEGTRLEDVEINTKYTLELQKLEEILPKANFRQICPPAVKVG